MEAVGVTLLVGGAVLVSAGVGMGMLARTPFQEGIAEGTNMAGVAALLACVFVGLAFK